MAQIKKEHIKQTILDNALRLFERNGYSNTTMKQIARASKVSVGNIYKYFNDKYEIFRSVVTKEFIQQLRDLLIKHAVLSIKCQFVELDKQDREWLGSVYYPFFVQNDSKCILLANYSKGSDYMAIIRSIANKLMDVKIKEYSKYRKSTICDEFVKLSTYIIMSNVELYVRILSSNDSEQEKIKLLQLADQYHVRGIGTLNVNLNKESK